MRMNSGSSARPTAWLLVVAIALSGATAGTGVAFGGSGAGTQAKHRRRAIKVKTPKVTIAGHRAKVHGRIARRLRVRGVKLERQHPPHKHWRVIKRARVKGRRFVFHVRTPRKLTGALKLRVVAGHPRRPKAKSRVFALAVTRTKVLKPSGVVSAPSPGQSGTLVYNGSSKPPASGYVALGVGPKTPDGLLVHVTGVSGSPDHWRLDVKPASLFDAIPAGHLKLTPQSTRVKRVDGKRLAHGASAAKFPLKCSAGASAQASGSASLSLRPNLDMSWGWNWWPPHPVLNSARFAMTAGGSIGASASLQGSGSCSFKKELFKHDFAPFDVQVGPVPVVIVPELLTTLTADASASASISTDLQGSLSATGGIQYSDGHLAPIQSFTKSFTFDPPTPQGRGSIGARLIPAGRLLIYGLAGPEVDLSGGPQFDVTPFATPTWRLHVPIDLSAKLVVPDTPLSLGPLDVYSHDFTLAQGPTGGGKHQLKVTVNGAGRVSGNGISCPGTCTGSYPAGTKVTLQASPNAGASFNGWGGDCKGTGGCTLDMSTDHSVSAHFSGPSTGYIYWTDFTTGTGTTGGSIARANLDGTNVNQSFITGASNPAGVAVDSSHVYWTNCDCNGHDGNGTIGRANLDGTHVNQSFITGAGAPSGVAVDGSHIYWANGVYSPNGPHNTIGRANLDGSNVNQTFITTAGIPQGLAVDGSHIYWADQGPNTIGRANLDGTNVNESFISGGSNPTGVAVNGSHIYWTNCDCLSKTIGRANLDGSNVNQSFIIAGAGRSRGVAVESSHIYWTNENPNSIARANLDGTNVNQSFISGIHDATGVAVDAGR